MDLLWQFVEFVGHFQLERPSPHEEIVVQPKLCKKIHLASDVLSLRAISCTPPNSSTWAVKINMRSLIFWSLLDQFFTFCTPSYPRLSMSSRSCLRVTPYLEENEDKELDGDGDKDEDEKKDEGKLTRMRNRARMRNRVRKRTKTKTMTRTRRRTSTRRKTMMRKNMIFYRLLAAILPVWSPTWNNGNWISSFTLNCETFQFPPDKTFWE